MEGGGSSCSRPCKRARNVDSIEYVKCNGVMSNPLRMRKTWWLTSLLISQKVKENK